MEKPEWKKELEDASTSERLAILLAVAQHNVPEKHRTIYISTVAPSATDGENGEIWITYDNN